MDFGVISATRNQSLTVWSEHEVSGLAPFRLDGGANRTRSGVPKDDLFSCCGGNNFAVGGKGDGVDAPSINFIRHVLAAEQLTGTNVAPLKVDLSGETTLRGYPRDLRDEGCPVGRKSQFPDRFPERLEGLASSPIGH